jgi:hypothetical protein
VENLSQFILWSSILLELALLVAGLRNRLAGRFPIFFGYIAFVLSQDVLTIFAVHWSRQVYTVVYWVTEFSGLALGSLVVFEIYKVSLAAYPGTARMARNALAFVFVTALAKGLAQAMASPLGWPTETPALEIERALVSQQTRDFWYYAYSASYVTALSLWLGHLWSYQPIPQPKASLELEYQRIAVGTRRRLQEARGYLRKAVRS